MAEGTHSSSVNLRRRRRYGEQIIQSLLFLAAAISILTTIGIVYVLGRESLRFFTSQMWEDTNKQLAGALTAQADWMEVNASGSPLNVGDVIRVGEEQMQVLAVDGLRVQVQRGVNETPSVAHTGKDEIFREHRIDLITFLTGRRWEPQIGYFGVLPLVNATLMVSLIAMLVALPLGMAIAIYLSEYAPERVRAVLKPVLEVLAGIPTVVYGYFALTFVTPLLRRIFGVDMVEVYNMASAGIVIGILIIPLVSSLSEDALRAVPDALRQAAYGLGATKLETALKVVVPAAISGISAAFILAISRAIGETMIVAIAAGAGPNFTFNPFESAETMTGHIVRISGGDLSYDSIDYSSIFAIGLLLFLITLSLNIISQRIVRRFREVYD